MGYFLSSPSQNPVTFPPFGCKPASEMRLFGSPRMLVLGHGPDSLPTR
jgi:hypothetical protein